MAEISKKIRQSKVLCGENKIPYARAVTLMSLFTFTFLGAEFLFVNIIARTASGNLSVNAKLCARHLRRRADYFIIGKRKKAVLPK